MANILPATGTAISMGRTGAAFSGGASTTSVSIGNSSTVKLNGYIGRSPTINTPFSNVFGGRTTPFNY
jgi:hypothetical protein